MRDGATQRFGCVDGTITSANVQAGSAIASYTLRVIVVDVDVRHRAVGLGIEVDEERPAPRSESAAARLMAVVVFPTPPF